MSPGMHLQVNPANIPSPAVKTQVVVVRIDKNLAKHAKYLVEPHAYRVGPSDILNIVVWDHPELTIPQGQYRSPSESGIEVMHNGQIYFPFAGNINVSGMTVEQIRRILAKRLAPYIRNPQVSVNVASYHAQKIQVLGSVNKPTTEPITNVPLSLIDAINQAGSFNSNSSNPSQVFVIRPSKPDPVLFVLNANDPGALVMAENFYMRDKDVVYVSRKPLSDWNRLLTSLVPSVSAGYVISTFFK